MRIGPLLSICLFISLTLYNCQEAGLSYKEETDIDPYGWKYDDQVSFENVTLAKDQSLCLRLIHADHYKYENINLKALVLNGADTILDTTMSIDLANDIGQWKGKQKGSGFQVEEVLSSVSVNEQTALKVVIGQHSRDEALKGIEEVELVVKSDLK